jgi:hypothetical protein
VTEGHTSGVCTVEHHCDGGTHILAVYSTYLVVDECMSHFESSYSIVITLKVHDNEVLM